MGGQSMKGNDLDRELAELRRLVADMDRVEDWAEAIIAAMGDAVSIQNPEFRVLYQNYTHRRIVGGDKTGQFCFQAYSQNDSVCDGCALEKALRDGKVHRHERSSFDGAKERHFEVVASPLRNSKGDIIAGIELVREITEFKRGASELEYRNLLFQTQMETSPDGILVVDEDGKWLSFNRRFVEMWGMPEEIVETRSDEEGLQFVLDKVEDPDEFLVQVHSLYENTDARSASEIKLLDGRTFERFSAPVTSPEGEYLGRVWYLRDVTMRKETERMLHSYREHLQDMVSERTSELTEMTAELTAAVELLSEQINERRSSEKFVNSILESIDESLIVLGPDFKMISANRAFCESVGMPLQEVIGKHCYQLLHGRQSPCFEGGESCSARRVFKSGEPSAAAHTHIRRGDNIFVETKTYPMRDGDGEVHSVIQIINDVTEKRRLEEQLRHSQKMEAIGQLAGGVAHDFNNRLAAIMNYAFILKSAISPDDPMRVHVNQIVASAERAAHLTQNLLTFSRKHVLDPRPVNINSIVEGVEKLLLRVIGEDIELKTEYSGDELIVMADSGQMEHVLINLATNARDAMPGSGQVAIGTARVELGPEFFEGRSISKPGPYALISFMDSGSGMSSAIRQKVFEPFFTTKEVGKGTGLGLSMVYGIVKQHGGYIRVESEPGLGTNFYIFLPLLPARAKKTTRDETHQPPRRGSETVLLVEDDDDVRKPVRQTLEGFGYEVIEAVDGEDAVEKYLQSRKMVDLLVLDVVLPGRSGVDVLNEIRKVSPAIKAIFTSGYSREQVKGKGLAETGEAFLSKPVAPEVLLEKVREVLDA